MACTHHRSPVISHTLHAFAVLPKLLVLFEMWCSSTSGHPCGRTVLELEIGTPQQHFGRTHISKLRRTCAL